MTVRRTFKTPEGDTRRYQGVEHARNGGGGTPACSCPDGLSVPQQRQQQRRPVDVSPPSASPRAPATSTCPHDTDGGPA
jgi:hypothetical protein